MRVLVVSNLYPPHHQGGYELRCRQVTEFLRQQGHDVRVISSSYEINGTDHGAAVREDSVNGIPVSRFLRQHRLDPRQPGGKLYNLDVVRRQIADVTKFGEVLNQFNPELVSWWNLEGVTKAILRMPQDRGVPSVFWIEDNWMIREFGSAGDVDLPFWFGFWRVNWGPSLLRPIVRVGLAPLERRMKRRGIPTRVFGVPPGHVCFISGFFRFTHEQAGLDVRSSDVIYGGVSPQQFYTKRSVEDYADSPLRLLYAGYIDQPRGLHTIVEALGLIRQSQRDRIHLSIAHAGPIRPDKYVNSITARIAQLGLTNHVTFLGRVSHDEMPAVYAAHHVLVFPSVRNEGMPMVMMEAMCAGCAAANTGSGGAYELAERAAAPLFPKDHPFALSRLLSDLEKDRARLAEIALRGQQMVLQEFTIQQMLEKAGEVFARVARQHQAPELETVSPR